MKEKIFLIPCIILISLTIVFGESAKVNITNPLNNSFAKGTVNISANITVNAWPIVGSVESGGQFGWRKHPITGENKFHKGIDIDKSLEGTDVRAVFGGRVTKVKTQKDKNGNVIGYGNYIEITTLDGTKYIYAHLQDNSKGDIFSFVREGDQVQAGDKIGRVGSTGGVTGPHLHFEVRPPPDNNPVDPVPYLEGLKGKLLSDFVVKCSAGDEGVIGSQDISGWGSHT